MSYRVNLKQCAAKLDKQGHPIMATARLCGVSCANLHHWIKQQDLPLHEVKSH